MDRFQNHSLWQISLPGYKMLQTSQIRGQNHKESSSPGSPRISTDLHGVFFSSKSAPHRLLWWPRGRMVVVDGRAPQRGTKIRPGGISVGFSNWNSVFFSVDFPHPSPALRNREKSFGDLPWISPDIDHGWTFRVKWITERNHWRDLFNPGQSLWELKLFGMPENHKRSKSRHTTDGLLIYQSNWLLMRHIRLFAADCGPPNPPTIRNGWLEKSSKADGFRMTKSIISGSSAPCPSSPTWRRLRVQSLRRSDVRRWWYGLFPKIEKYVPIMQDI